jgi:hypothetical protein
VEKRKARQKLVSQVLCVKAPFAAGENFDGFRRDRGAAEGAAGVIAAAPINLVRFGRGLSGALIGGGVPAQRVAHSAAAGTAPKAWSVGRKRTARLRETGNRRGPGALRRPAFRRAEGAQ